MSLEVVDVRGWDVVRLSSEQISVDVVPGKGGDILAVREQASGVNVLWTSPWGLRARGSVPTAAGSQTNFLEHYPGGWQTLFPNGGGPTDHGGTELPFHGEATLVPWDWADDSDAAASTVVLATCLMRSPFRLHRRVEVVGDTVTVTERFTNEARTPQRAMWSHHPAFGAPFLDAGCRLETTASTFVADEDYDTPNGDLAPGERASWPFATREDGGQEDLSRVPAVERQVDRFGYLLEFADPVYSLTNPDLGITATVRWDAEAFPYAWFWCEASGSPGFPWYQRAYVLAVEPAASYPGHGLQVAMDRTGAVVEFAPGETKSAWVSMRVHT